MLVERQEVLGEFDDRLAEAVAGHGRMVFVGGEAGAGKTAVVREFARAQRDRMLVRIGIVDNITTAAAFAAFEDAVPELASRLASGGDGAAVERVRLFRELRDTIAARAGILVLDDLHWADQLTLDALRYLGRRLDGVPVLILVTYRSEQVSPRHRLAGLLGDLAGASGVSRVTVPPLTVDGVAELVRRSGSSASPRELYALTGGNPFFVTELLAGGWDELPATVSDAVLVRVGRLTSAGRDVAAAAPVLGMTADTGLLMAVAGRDTAAVDEVVDAGILVPQPGGVGYRHELARRAVEESLTQVRRRRLHRRALLALQARTPEDHRTLAHHAVGCGDDRAATRHATLAAQRAARLGAHREAAEHYRTALAHGAGEDRAALFEALSYECYLTDQLREALTARQRALELHELVGDRLSAGDDQRWLSRLSWFLGRGADAERYGTLAIDSLEPLQPGSELAMAFSNLAQLRMLADDTDAAAAWGERALALATTLGETEIRAHALNNLGSAAVSAGRVAEGEALLSRSLDLALASDLHEHAARAYTNLSSGAVRQHRFTAAIAFLDAGIAYCTDRDLDSWARYMGGWRCVVLADLGRFDEAIDQGTALLAHPDLAPVSAVPSAVAVVRARARRGEDASVELALATDLAAATGELQRMAPVACAAAEDAWLRGETPAIAGLTDAAWSLAARHPDAWLTGELAWWRMLGGVPAFVDSGVAEPFTALLSGAEGAPGLWDPLGSPVWSAYARLLSADVSVADRGVRLLDEVGADRCVSAVLRTRRERGLLLPRRARAAARGHPAQLTDREFEVLRMLARGLSTADIATALVLSRRTVEHHVSAVLRKLGEPTRARAVAAARRDGMLNDRAG